MASVLLNLEEPGWFISGMNCKFVMVKLMV